MKEFNHTGLLLAEYQGKLFEKSYDLNCSTGIYIRRFLHSNLLIDLDGNNPALVSLDSDEGIRNIQEQFGDTSYGKEKFQKNVLFWMGYFYRYIAYTREQSTRFIMKLFNYRQLNELYYVFHTQDPEWCIRNLLELNGITDEIFDNNYRLKQVIKKRGNY